MIIEKVFIDDRTIEHHVLHFWSPSELFLRLWGKKSEALHKAPYFYIEAGTYGRVCRYLDETCPDLVEVFEKAFEPITPFQVREYVDAFIVWDIHNNQYGTLKKSVYTIENFLYRWEKEIGEFAPEDPSTSEEMREDTEKLNLGDIGFPPSHADFFEKVLIVLVVVSVFLEELENLSSAQYSWMLEKLEGLFYGAGERLFTKLSTEEPAELISDVLNSAGYLHPDDLSSFFSMMRNWLYQYGLLSFTKPDNSENPISKGSERANTERSPSDANDQSQGGINSQNQNESKQETPERLPVPNGSPRILRGITDEVEQVVVDLSLVENRDAPSLELSAPNAPSELEPIAIVQMLETEVFIPSEVGNLPEEMAGETDEESLQESETSLELLDPQEPSSEPVTPEQPGNPSAEPTFSPGSESPELQPPEESDGDNSPPELVDPNLPKGSTLVSDFSGGSNKLVLTESSSPIEISNFGGVGRSINPSQETLKELDTIEFEGDIFSVENIIFKQSGNNLLIKFYGLDKFFIELKNFELDKLDNISYSYEGFQHVGNIIFNGQSVISDSFDVVDSDDNRTSTFGTDKLIVFNDLDNVVYGRKGSNDIIHGQGGNDTLIGLSGDDLLRGGEGDDLLYGGAGLNRLYGGLGSDGFGLSLGGFSEINDFSSEDYIVLPEGIRFEDLNIYAKNRSNRFDGVSTVISIKSTNQIIGEFLVTDPSSVDWKAIIKFP